MKRFVSMAAAMIASVVLAMLSYTATADEVVACEEHDDGIKTIAVFVQNRTRVPGMDDEVDGVRDRLSVAFAQVDGFAVMASAQIVDVFRRYKVSTEDEKTGVFAGIFTGGSVPRIAQMLGCDYIAAATIVSASSMHRNMGGRTSTVFTLRMTLKVMDANGASVDCLPTWVKQYPVLDSVDDSMNFYQMLFDQWAEDLTAAIAQKSLNWRKPCVLPAKAVAFHVSTTIDDSIPDLDSQTKGANGEMLQELRRIAGGVTVEIDGAVVGSAPGDFQVASGLHQLRVTREWMKPYTATVNIVDGTSINVALEMSDEGMAKWGSLEALRADIARRYAEAVRERGVKVNIDTSGWRDVGNSGIMIIRD